MSEEEPSEDILRKQREALDRASEAARSGDPMGMLEGLAESRHIDGLVRRLHYRWPRLTQRQVEEAVTRAIDTAYEDVRSGKCLTGLPGWLWKVGHRNCRKVGSDQAVELVTAPETLERLAEGGEGVASVGDAGTMARSPHRRAERIAKGISLVHQLIPRLGGPNIQAVMKFIFDAVASGVPDVTAKQIGEALGLQPDTVRMLRSRGFKRLHERARREGMTIEITGIEGFPSPEGGQAGGDEDFADEQMGEE